MRAASKGHVHGLHVLLFAGNGRQETEVPPALELYNMKGFKPGEPGQGFMSAATYLLSVNYY